jgi:hypothetical protein
LISVEATTVSRFNSVNAPRMTSDMLPGRELAAFLALRPLERLDPEQLRLDQRARIQPRHGILSGDFSEYGDAETPEDYRRVAVSVIRSLKSASPSSTILRVLHRRKN